MDKIFVRKTALVTLGITAMSAFSATIWAQAQAIDPAAVRALQKMTEYVSQLEKFSVHTENTLEEIFDSGQRIDFDISAKVMIRRPDKLVAERVGEEVEQSFYYDGETLTLHMDTASEIVFATMEAPGTVEELLDFSRENLGITMPVSDLVYRNVQAILMKDVSAAQVVGETTIGNRTCTHLAFRKPGVDFQVWIETGVVPLPCKYVVTDTSTPALVSIVSVMSDWDLEPSATDAEFQYAPVEQAKSVTFLPLASGSDR